MAYVTGSAIDITALRTAFFNACTDNGWTLSGEVLRKGAVYTRVQIVSGALHFLGGTGIDGSNNLTGAAPQVSRLGRPSTGAPDIAWPISYEVFILTDPDEVYLVVNYNVDCYLWAAFGQSSVSGLSGTGGWFAASLCAQAQSAATWIAIAPTYGGYQGGVGVVSPGLFWGTTTNGAVYHNSMIHHGLDGAGWNLNTATAIASAVTASGTLLSVLPNSWNNESVLIPIQVWIPRTAGANVSLVADLGHARHLRIDNHAPGEIVTLGADKWKIFPCFQKNTAVRNGGSAVNHSGTMGWAVRYDGA